MRGHLLREYACIIAGQASPIARPSSRTFIWAAAGALGRRGVAADNDDEARAGGDADLIDGDVGRLPRARNPSTRPMVVVVLPSPYGVGVIALGAFVDGNLGKVMA